MRTGVGRHGEFVADGANGIKKGNACLRIGDMGFFLKIQWRHFGFEDLHIKVILVEEGGDGTLARVQLKPADAGVISLEDRVVEMLARSQVIWVSHDGVVIFPFPDVEPAAC